MDEINKLQGQILEHTRHLYETDCHHVLQNRRGYPEDKPKLVDAKKIDELRARIKVPKVNWCRRRKCSTL